LEETAKIIESLRIRMLKTPRAGRCSTEVKSIWVPYSEQYCLLNTTHLYIYFLLFGGVFSAGIHLLRLAGNHFSTL